MVYPFETNGSLCDHYIGRGNTTICRRTFRPRVLVAWQLIAGTFSSWRQMAWYRECDISSPIIQYTPSAYTRDRSEFLSAHHAPPPGFPRLSGFPAGAFAQGCALHATSTEFPASEVEWRKDGVTKMSRHQKLRRWIVRRRKGPPRRARRRKFSVKVLLDAETVERRDNFFAKPFKNASHLSSPSDVPKSNYLRF